jgi:hypothetical protein
MEEVDLFVSVSQSHDRMQQRHYVLVPHVHDLHSSVRASPDSASFDCIISH